MPSKYHILSFFLFLFLSLQVFAQRYIEVRGQVTEVTNGVPKGIPNILVQAIGEDYDETGEDGSFVLTLPADKESVTIILENCPLAMIAPPQGEILIPPSGFINIRVCGAQNKELRRKVNALEGELDEYRRKYNLSRRQVLEMHDRMTDTVIYFQKNIAELNANIESLKRNQTENEAEIESLLEEVEYLKEINREQERRIKQLLLDRFILQNEVFEQISKSFRVYVTALYNLKDKLPRIGACYVNGTAFHQMENAKLDYSIARDHIDATFDSKVSEVRELWKDPAISRELEETYRFLLSNLHDKNIYVMNEDVFGPMKDWTTGEMGRSKAKKASEKAAGEALPKVNLLTSQLEEKIDDIINKLQRLI